MSPGEMEAMNIDEHNDAHCTGKCVQLHEFCACPGAVAFLLGRIQHQQSDSMIHGFCDSCRSRCQRARCRARNARQFCDCDSCAYDRFCALKTSAMEHAWDSVVGSLERVQRAAWTVVLLMKLGSCASAPVPSGLTCLRCDSEVNILLPFRDDKGKARETYEGPRRQKAPLLGTGLAPA